MNSNLHSRADLLPEHDWAPGGHGPGKSAGQLQRAAGPAQQGTVRPLAGVHASFWGSLRELMGMMLSQDACKRILACQSYDDFFFW
jgi:hypothetical protein